MDFAFLQTHDRCSPASTRGVGVVKGIYPVERGQKFSDAFPLCSDSPPVDQPHLAKSCFPRRLEKGERDVADLSRPKGMQVDGVGDRDIDYVFGVHGLVASR